MNEPLHPSTLGEILDRTVQLYRSRFLVLLGIAFIPTGVVLAVAMVLFLFFAWVSTSAASTPPEVVGIAAFLVIGTLFLAAIPLFIAVTALGTAAINHAVARPWQDEKITIREAYRTAWKRGWSYIGLFLLEALIVWFAPMAVWIVLLIVSAGVAAVAQSAGMGAAAGAIFALGTFAVVIVLAAYCIWMLLRLCLAFPACVVEQIGATAALRRSISLSRGTKGRVFLLYLLGTALNYLLTLAFTIPAFIAIALLPGAGNPKYAQTAGTVMIIVVYGAAFAIQALTKPVYGIALMLFYYDQRIRQEGFDIELLMQQAGLVAPPPSQPPAQTWPQSILHRTQAAEIGLPESAVLQQPAEPTHAKSEESL
jgi:hypothetical protein